MVIYYNTVGPGRLKTDVWTQTSSDDGVAWCAAEKVTSAQTDETGSGADPLGNEYGDYNGLSGFSGIFFPTWADRRSGAREEISADQDSKFCRSYSEYSEYCLESPTFRSQMGASSSPSSKTAVRACRSQEISPWLVTHSTQIAPKIVFDTSVLVSAFLKQIEGAASFEPLRFSESTAYVRCGGSTGHD